MIYVEMGGRYGNQLFHYACARYVQIKTGDKDLVLNYNPIFRQHRESEGWIDVLQDLNVVPYSYYEKQGTVLKNETSFLQKVLIAPKAFQIKFLSGATREERAQNAGWLSMPLNRMGVYWIREGMKSITPNPRKKKHIVTGTCECPDVFDEIGDVLRKELIPKNPPIESNRRYLDMMDATNSVCIHVRRGDFFTPENVKSFGVCTVEYYRKAYQKMLEQGLENTHFFVISDDIAWCKQHLNLAENGGGYNVCPR